MAGTSDEPDGDARCDRDKTVVYVISIGMVGLLAIIMPLVGVPGFNPRYATQVTVAGLVLLISGFAIAWTPYILDRNPTSAVVATGCAAVVMGASVVGVGSTLAMHRVSRMQMLTLAQA